VEILLFEEAIAALVLDSGGASIDEGVAEVPTGATAVLHTDLCSPIHP
jgi:hypothetical protein